MAHRVATNTLVKTLVGDVATWPLIVSIGAGAAVCTYYLGRLAFQHPDTKAFPEQRKSAVIQNQRKGADYYGHDLRVTAVELAKNDETREVFGNLNKSAIASRSKQY